MVGEEDLDIDDEPLPEIDDYGGGDGLGASCWQSQRCTGPVVHVAQCCLQAPRLGFCSADVSQQLCDEALTVCMSATLNPACCPAGKHKRASLQARHASVAI